MLAQLICAAILSSFLGSGLQAQSEIEKLGRPYTDRVGDINATLTYWPAQTGSSSLIFKATNSAANPAFEAQCQLLDRLLGRVLHDSATEKTFDVALGSMQEYFVQKLRDVLFNSSEWDAVRGRPRKGEQLGDFLTGTLNKSGILDPVAKVFDRHGMFLSASGMGRIDIERMPAMKGARLPSYIWTMHFIARQR